MIVELQPLPHERSTNIAATGYDPDTQTLAVRFKSGKTYHYKGVEREVAEGLGQSRSPGKFLFANIRDSYDYELLDEPAGD